MYAATSLTTGDDADSDFVDGVISNVVLEVRSWLSGAMRPHFVALALGPMAVALLFASKAQVQRPRFGLEVP